MLWSRNKCFHGFHTRHSRVMIIPYTLTSWVPLIVAKISYSTLRLRYVKAVINDEIHLKQFSVYLLIHVQTLTWITQRTLDILTFSVMPESCFDNCFSCKQSTAVSVYYSFPTLMTSSLSNALRITNPPWARYDDWCSKTFTYVCRKQ